MLLLTLVVCFLLAVLFTPGVIRLAKLIGATDAPNERKVHQKVMPRLGGLAIFLAFISGYFIIRPEDPLVGAILLGGFVILVTGILDDIYELSAKAKLLGQIIAALVVVLGGIQIEFINLPFGILGGRIEFGYFSIPLTIFWILAITNAINLIDGLDGLASGVSAIALMTIGFMAMLMSNTFVMVIALLLVASIAGFMVFNFYPAKIFMGDSGALFLGYMISVLALLGFKNITIISLVIPLIILGVPLADTLFAIIRRKVNRQSIAQADKSHLHHCLLRMGFTHRQTVIIIYTMAALFGVFAILFSMSTVWGAILVMALMFLVIELTVESIGLVGKEYRPLLNLLRVGVRERKF